MKKIFIISLLLSLGMLANAQTKQSPSILYIGDSITDGNWGHQCNTNERNLTDLNHIFGHGYMFICASDIMSRYPQRNYHFYNRGISGNTINDMANRWQKDCLDLQPDVLTVLIGINDVNLEMSQRADKSGVSVDNYDAKYRMLLDQALSQNPNLKLVIISPFIFKVGRYTRNWEEWSSKTKIYAKAAQKIAIDYGALYIDGQALFEKLLRKYPDIPISYWSWDGIHPTAAGHKIIADSWLKIVKLPK